MTDPKPPEGFELPQQRPDEEPVEVKAAKGEQAGFTIWIGNCPHCRAQWAVSALPDATPDNLGRFRCKHCALLMRFVDSGKEYHGHGQNIGSNAHAIQKG